jgi:hypothetical protein
MPFWLVLVLFAASTILGQLFRPKVAGTKPATLTDFNFPTADETRRIPRVYGTVKLAAPNVVSVTDFSTEPIVKKTRNPMTLFLTSTKTTTGYRYFCGIEMALSYQFDALTQIIIGDKIAWSGSVTTDSEILINNKTLFGGDDPTSGGNGGVWGYLGVHVGLPNASKDPYLLSQYGNYSAHRGVGYVVWKGQKRTKGSGYIGNSTQIDAWAFVVRAIPANIPGGSAYANINSGDANPAEIIYDVLRNSEYAVGMNGAFIDDGSFLAASQVFYNDGFGVSAGWDNQKPCREVINNLLQLTDSVLYSDLSTGKMVLKPARADYDPSILQSFDETNIGALVSYSRGAWAETTNEVKVPFVDRMNNFISRIQPAQDIANVRIQAAVISAQIDHIGISNSTTAGNIAMRDLRAMTTPLAKHTIQLNRQAYKLVPGAVYKWSWSDIQDENNNSIQNMIMRVLSVKYGEGTVPIIEVEGIEDLFNSANTVQAALPASGGTAVTTAPVDASTQVLYDLPYFLSGNDSPNLWAMVVAPNADHASFDLFDSTDNVTFDPDVLHNTFTPSGLLLNAYAQNTPAIDTGSTFIIDGTTGVDLSKLIPAGVSDIASGFNLMLVVQSAAFEIMAFQGVTLSSGNYVFTNVWRGLLDTVPQIFTSGARVLFFSYGDARGERVWQAGALAYAKALTRTLQGVLDPASATLLSKTVTPRAARPIAPGNMTVNGSMWLSTLPSTGTLTVSWAHRDRTRQNTVIAQSDTSIPNAEGGATYHLKIYNAVGTLIFDLPGLTSTSYAITNAAEIAANGGVLADALTFVLYTERDGVSSLQAQVRGITRTGTAPYVPAYSAAGTYAAPPRGNATAIAGVPITGTPTGTNNTPIYNPTTGVITWAPGGGTVTVQEIDGSPSGVANTIQVPNGQLTDMGGGVFRITPLQGATGPTGATGATGATGPTGATGATGASGAAGANGSTWYTGTSVPSSGTGINGDFYLRIVASNGAGNGDVYQKVSGAWGSPIGNLQGSTGTSGSSGTSAVNGPDRVPASPNAEDEEFDSTTLASKWTLNVTGTPVAELNTRIGSCVALKMAGATDSWEIIQAITVGSTDFSYTVKWSGWMQGADYQLINLYVSNAAVTTYVNMVFGYNSGLGGIFVDGDTDTGGATIPKHNFSNLTEKGWVYMHLQRLGSNAWSIWYSFDGISWFTIGSTTKAFTPDHLHVAANQTVAAKARWAIDWVRRDWLFL